ncbi:MAG TPA: DUF3566 domain-containing protein [Jatrophihabitans sp.]|nr:DUF3566 domain-containing protein [Jatrophihabitans sp.]
MRQMPPRTEGTEFGKGSVRSTANGASGAAAPASAWSAPMAATSAPASLGSSAPAPGSAEAPTASVPYIPGASRSGSTGAAHTDRAARARGPRRARLQLRHINAWTVLKFSAVLSIALFFVWLIMIGVLFGILDGAGIIGKINDAVTTINGPGSNPPITATVVFGGAAIIGVVNIVLFIALSTIGSVVYNLCADLVGGIEVTLSER